MAMIGSIAALTPGLRAMAFQSSRERQTAWTAATLPLRPRCRVAEMKPSAPRWARTITPSSSISASSRSGWQR